MLHRHSAAGEDSLTVHPEGVVRCEKDGNWADIFRQTNATQWRILDLAVVEVAFENALRLGSFGLDQAGSRPLTRILRGPNSFESEIVRLSTAPLVAE
jgi:hypothetical protein